MRPTTWKTGVAKFTAAVLAGGLAVTSASAQTLAEAEAATKRAQDWLAGTGVTAGKVTYDGEPIVIRASIQTPPPAIHTKTWLQEFKNLETMTNGKLKVELRHSGVVHKVTDGLEAIRSGLTDYTFCWSFLNSSGYNLVLATQLPGVFPNGETAAIVAEKLHKKYFRDEYDRQGVYVAHLGASTRFEIYSKDRISTLDELAGKKVRTGGGIYTAIFERLGATPVSMSSADFYTALQRGLLDGVTTTASAAQVFKLHEVAKFSSDPNVSRVVPETCVRPGLYDDLPADLKQIFNDWNRINSQVMPQIMYRLAGAKSQNFFREQGMEIIKLTDAQQQAWLDKVSPLIDEYVAEQTAAGRPAKELMDELRTLVETYAKKSPNDLMQEVQSQPIQDFAH